MSEERVLVVDDEVDIRELLGEILSEEGYAVSVAGDAATARRLRDELPPDLVLLDIWMPDTDGITLLEEWRTGSPSAPPVIIMSGHSTIETAVEATRLGAADFIEKPLSLAQLLATVRTALGNPAPVGAPSAHAGSVVKADLIGTSDAIAALREHVAQWAHGAGPLLVHGEPGTGRRTVAAALHQQSGREPWVECDLGRVGTAGATSDALFGDAGAWQRAGQGTLVLYDPAELDARSQSCLVEYLEAAAGNGPRLIALTGEDLTALVASGRFRSDLFHVLNTGSLHVPPLRDHAEDLPELLGHFVDRLVAREGLAYRHFTVAAQNRLRHHDWPGNVAELASLVTRLLRLGGPEAIDLASVDAALTALRPPLPPATAMPLPLELPLREARERFERAYLSHQLRAVGGRMGELAQRVGMERTHLYRKLKQLGIEYGQR